MTGEKGCEKKSRVNRRNKLFQTQLDFRVPDTCRDSSKRKSMPANAISASIQDTVVPEDDEDDDEVLYDDWEERAAAEEDLSTPRRGHEIYQEVGARKLYNDGRTYPLDVWFLIGNYIAPESVGTFARLCKGSLVVLRTFKFWSTLYAKSVAKTFDKEEDVEETLKVTNVVRPFGVRFHVIQSLYKFYPRFKESLIRQRLNSVDLDGLIGYRCLNSWTSQGGKNAFVINVKFQKSSQSRELSDRASLFNDTSTAVMHNPFDGVIVIQIICDHFIPFSSPMGLFVSDVKYNSSRDMRNMRLQLGLSTSYKVYASSSSSSFASSCRKPIQDETRTLDPVNSVRLLHWWHPDFPVSITSARLPDTTVIDENWDVA